MERELYLHFPHHRTVFGKCKCAHVNEMGDPPRKVLFLSSFQTHIVECIRSNLATIGMQESDDSVAFVHKLAHVFAYVRGVS